MEIHVAARTHTGRVREHNEDAIFADKALGLYLVADGMGGHAAGEVASQLVVDVVRQAVASGHSLPAALHKAHADIKIASSQGIGKPGMGSTVVAALLRGRVLTIAWVGDSRAYLFRNTGDRVKLTQLTRDHSFVQRLMDAGAINAEEARNHPKRNLITQSLGAEQLDDVEVDEIKLSLQPGDIVLLCSDGLSGELRDNELEKLIEAHSEDIDSLVECLIDAACEAGGNDNISVVVISVPTRHSKVTCGGWQQVIRKKLRSLLRRE